MIESNPKIVIITPLQTFLTRSFKEKLLENNIESIELKPTVNQLSNYKESVDGMVIFANEEIVQDMTLMVFIKDMVIGDDIPLFIIGKPEEITIMENVFPANTVKGAFMRPIDIGAIVDNINKYLRFFKSENQKCILVVDDSGAALRSAKGMFEDKYHVMLANSATTAIMSMTVRKPDLVLMDYEMPVINGKQAYEMMRSEMRFSDVPVMFLTGRDDAMTVTSIMVLRPAAYLLKSSPAADIVKTVDNFFQQQKAKL